MASFNAAAVVLMTALEALALGAAGVLEAPSPDEVGALAFAVCGTALLEGPG